MHPCKPHLKSRTWTRFSQGTRNSAFCLERERHNSTARASLKRRLGLREIVVALPGARVHLSRVGSPDDDVGVERVELCGEHGALRGQLILRSVLHRHRPALHCGVIQHEGFINIRKWYRLPREMMA